MYVLVCILLALLGRAVMFNIWHKSIRKLLGVLINNVGLWLIVSIYVEFIKDMILVEMI